MTQNSTPTYQIDEQSVCQKVNTEELAEPSAVSTTKKEKFIPVTRYALLDRIDKPDAWPEGLYDDCMGAVNNLAAWRHQIYSKRLSEINKHYLPFSPDRDTVRILEYSDEELDQNRASFIEQIVVLLEQANYEKITQEELDAYFTAQGPYGLNLKVDMDEYDESLAYYRGSDTQTHWHRDWKTLFIKKRSETIPIFQRLFLLLKLKPAEDRIEEIMEKEGISRKKAEKRLNANRKNLPDDVSTDHIYLRTFKNIPQSDLEMLFPNTKVEFRPFDKLKLIVTAGGGTLSGIVGTATKVLAATNPVTLIIAIIGLGGIIFRQISNFFNQRNRYMMTLAQNLYFHSLANNRGALTLLLDRAEEEDIKEEILLYAYLVHNDVPFHQRDAAKSEIETYLLNEFNICVEYDFDDALERLKEDGLAIETEDGSLFAVEPRVVKKQLAEKWMGCIDVTETVLDSNAA